MSDTVLAAFAAQAKRRGTSLCIVDADGEHTYEQVWEAACRMAGSLKEKGTGYRSCILASCDTRAHYLALELACWLLGAIFVPVEQDAAEKRILDIADETDPVLLASDRTYESDRLSRLSAPYDSLIREDGKKGEPSPYPIQPEDTAEILFTTGTTGKSKGVELTHGADMALAENVAAGVGMREENVELLPLPLSHAMALRCVYANYTKGGCVLLADGVSQVRHIYQLMKDYGATGLDLSPTAAAVLLKLSKGKFSEFASQLDFVHLGTAYLNDEIKEALRQTFPQVRLYNVYGSTESGRSCYYEFSKDPLRKHCIGLPAVHADFMIADDQHRRIESDPNHMGYLACKGPMNMKGYWRQKELTDSVLIDGYLFTRDEGYIDQDGYVYVLGRADDVINYRGIKIAPDEIEEAAMGYPGVRDCACIPKADPMSGQIPLLAIDMEEDAFDRKALMHFLRARIDADKVPQKIIICHQIPRSFNGKLQRKKLAALL